MHTTTFKGGFVLKYLNFDRKIIWFMRESNKQNQLVIIKGPIFLRHIICHWYWACCSIRSILGVIELPSIIHLSFSLSSPLHVDGLSHRGWLCGSNILKVKWPHWPRAVNRPLQQGRGSVGIHQKREAKSCMQRPVFMFCWAFQWEH